MRDRAYCGGRFVCAPFAWTSVRSPWVYSVGERGLVRGHDQ